MNTTSQAKEIVVISLFSMILIILGGYLYGGVHVAKNLGIGALISIINLYFYGFIFWCIFEKKEVASLVPLIVIKYSLLLVMVYCIWAYSDILLAVFGLAAELIVTALLWLFVRLVRK